SKRKLGTPKSGQARTVDLSRQAADLFRMLDRGRKAAALRDGSGEPSPWVFPGIEGGILDADRIRSAFKRVLRAAHLPEHFTPHSLRHSYASILISDGVSPAYVQRQLGHATYTLTVDTYGKWLPM